MRTSVFVSGLIVAAGVSSVVVGGGEDEREIVRESGSASIKQELLETYDTSDARIDLEKLMAPGVAKDGIPALTDPERVPVEEANWAPADRIIEVVIGGTAVGYPINVLNFHEIANDTVGGVPIAATYCPLCDSAAVVNRTLGEGEDARTLEFGVSGFLYNSNVVMYERGSMGLWSQVYMQAVSGQDAGKTLEHLPVRIVSFEAFALAHPDGEVLSDNTGHTRDYSANPYERYFSSPNMIFHAFDFDDRLPSKELGVGVLIGERAVFVTAASAMGNPVRIKTDAGDVVISASAAGVSVDASPEGVRTLQTFYHSWAAFHPETEIFPQ